MTGVQTCALPISWGAAPRGGSRILGAKEDTQDTCVRCGAWTLLAIPRLLNLTPALVSRRSVRRGPLSTVGGAESKERARGRRGGRLLRAPPSSLLGSSSPPLLPQPCSTRGEGKGVRREERVKGQKLRHRCRKQTYGHQGGKVAGWGGWCDELGDWD